jgi:DegV family protein with EDD domain
MTHHNIALITDSTCDLPDNLLREYDIGVVPLMVIWGTEELRDQVDIKSTEFYERLVSDPIHPTTSQPPVAAFVQAVRHAKENGATEVIIFTVSSGMSSTYQAAKQIENRVDIPVHVVDSKANSMSLGWQVLAAAVVQIPLDQKQTLLATNHAADLLTTIRTIYRYELPLLNAMIRFEANNDKTLVFSRN